MITKDKVKGFVMGALSATLVMAGTAAVFADPVSRCNYGSLRSCSSRQRE
jgi:hypothetical protein